MRVRVIAAGGDGTLSWVASSIEQIKLPYTPDIALLPLGTGNDLAKALNWGRYFTSLKTFRSRVFIHKVFTVSA
jgi:diacylglycerol kinase (ATP)